MSVFVVYAFIRLRQSLAGYAELQRRLDELEVLKERAIKSGFDFIDFWAVDFEHQDAQPFKQHWQQDY